MFGLYWHWMTNDIALSSLLLFFFWSHSICWHWAEPSVQPWFIKWSLKVTLISIETLLCSLLCSFLHLFSVYTTTFLFLHCTPLFFCSGFSHSWTEKVWLNNLVNCISCAVCITVEINSMTFDNMMCTWEYGFASVFCVTFWPAWALS